ncbi:rhombosortase [Steroidobacter sp. S1-65]|uniref:Rhombosortase n=1 Tax=Steroidobacter gossypii TaxID=2805490 RepID=A0ABS1WXA9_9GAMM|nr:rhombosortase [Steroidobacter gossypii]MBM0105572.1 rhombosortase [Steroidobacter gossypii]
MSDGLSRPAPASSRRFRQWMPDRRPGSWLLGLAWLTLVLLSLTGEGGQLALRYQRDAVLQGEYWRLITGHLVHGTPMHMVLNAAGLGLIAALFSGDYSWRAWLLIALFSMVAIDVAFVSWEPQLHWYVGLSGVLHGALAAGAVAWWRHESTRLALVLSAIFVGKLAWEQWQGALPLSGDLPVVVDAHLYGALGGAVAAALLWVVAHTQVADKSRS